MKTDLNEKKIAIVYDWFDKWGGVERILLVFKELFPQAIFYTSYVDLKSAFWAKNFNIKTSFIQNLPNFIKKNRVFSLPFYPLAFESFDFSNFNLVISITSSFAKGIITKPNTYHLCYLLTPTRFLWVMPENYNLKGITRMIISPYFNFLKKWDFVASKRPDEIISISENVANRCFKYYHRRSQVVYPPFDLTYWEKIKEIVNQKKNLNRKINQLIKKQYFLVVSRLEPYKKIDLVIKSFLKLKRKNWKQFIDFFLIIVGEGTEKKKLERIAKNEKIIFLSKVSDIDLAYLYSFAYGQILPQEEDFGYTVLEGLFFGCPIIAFKKGGVRETVIENKTGVFFNCQKEEDLISALERFHRISYNLKKATLRDSQYLIKKFDKKRFIEQFLRLLIYKNY